MTTVDGLTLLDGVERVLAVMAHPDDVDFGASGALSLLADRGVEVSYCIITDGDAGGFDPAVPRADIPGIRRAEQRDAAKVVGVDDVVFLAYPDGRLTSTIDLRRDISREIRRVRPQLVISQSPQRNFRRVYASHPDHLAAGEATLCAVYPDARNPFAHPELLADAGLDAWAVSEVWMMGGPELDVHVDITDVFERKVSALLCHDSQMTDPDGLEARMRAWGEATAHEAGLEPGRLAESFMRVPTA